jgi:hypothetical protein
MIPAKENGQSKKPTRLPLLGLLVVVFLAAFRLWVNAAEPKRIDVLYIGNSYTTHHGLPDMIVRLARAGKQPLPHYIWNAPGGATLEDHLERGEVIDQLYSRKWNFVVLQEQSVLPAIAPERMAASVRKLQDEIKRTGAQTVLYLTWARQGSPDMQAKLNKAYFDAAKEIGATVAPVGLAWQEALKEDPKLILYEADGSHPNQAGTYLTACVFYGVFYDASPEGLPSASNRMTAAQAKTLQAVAWRVVRRIKEEGWKRKDEG